MNTMPTLHRLLRPTTRSKGFALMLILGALVLMSAIAVSFLTSTAAELKSAKSYARSLQAQRYSTLPVNLAMAQITAATSEGTATDPVAWASQPGMIRTWNQDGKPNKVYKLYSWDQMIQPGDSFNPAAASERPPTDWHQNKALFVDMNEPAKGIYPIADPAAIGQVEGFSVTGAPVASGLNPNPLPMPVKWLYVLENGDLVLPTASGTNAVSIPGASATNPPVARIAYWTDDETAKVNINTASEGIFWDQPRGSTPQERGVSGNNTKPQINQQPNKVFGFGWSLPAQNEFQRTPGHPAMVCLSAVFNDRIARPGNNLVNADTYPTLSRYYSLSPRVTEGGSKGGTVLLDPNTQPLPLGVDRLYASVDELVFSPTGRNLFGTDYPGPADVKNRKFFLTAGSKAPDTTLFDTPRVSLWPLFTQTSLQNAKDKLFAFNSRLNNHIFSFQRTAANTGPGSGSSQNSTQDITSPAAGVRNQSLYNYLASTARKDVPGFGSSLGSKYPGLILDQIITFMFDYVRSCVNGRYGKIGTTPNAYQFIPTGQGQGQVIPIVMPNGTKGFGRMISVQEVILIFYCAGIVEETPGVPPPSPFPSDLKPDGTPRRIPYTNKIGLALFINPFLVAQGSPSSSPAFRFRVSGLNSITATSNLETATFFSSANPIRLGVNVENGADGRQALTGARQTMDFGNGNTRNVAPSNNNEFTNYRLIGDRFLNLTPVRYEPSRGSAGTFALNGGTLKIDIFNAFGTVNDATPPIQTININIPPTILPVPTLRREGSVSPPWGTTDMHYKNPGQADDTTSIFYTHSHINPMNFAERFNTGHLTGEGWEKASAVGSLTGLIKRGDVVRSITVRTDAVPFGDMRLVAALRDVPAAFFGKGPDYDSQATGFHHLHGHCLRYGRAGSNILYRLPIFPLSSTIYPHPPEIGTMDGNPKTRRDYQIFSTPVPGVTVPSSPGNRDFIPSSIVHGLGPKGATQDGNNLLGDWDNGFGNMRDGALINKTDEAATFTGSMMNEYDRLYFPDDAASATEIGISYNPSRQIASAVQFGSLPGGINPSTPESSVPWRTLLFAPNPAAGIAHPGHGTDLNNLKGPSARAPFAILPDHLFLDLFQMPVIEPYALTEQFATAGRVNLNHDIMPFRYIERSTALRAVLKPIMPAAIPTQAAVPTSSRMAYKFTEVGGQDNNLYGNSQTRLGFRYGVNVDATMSGLNRRFGQGDLYRSASEICSIFLVPLRLDWVNYPPTAEAPMPPTTYDEVALFNWWSNFLTTGDNTREAPYNYLYPHLTTRSNTYTVHWRVQVLEKPKNPNSWNETSDKVLSEYRGSTLIERFIDPNDRTIPDYATVANPPPLHNFYRWRIVNNTQFNP